MRFDYEESNEDGECILEYADSQNYITFIYKLYNMRSTPRFLLQQQRDTDRNRPYSTSEQKLDTERNVPYEPAAKQHRKLVCEVNITP